MRSLIQAGRSLARELKTALAVVALGWEEEEAGAQLALPGVSRILWADDRNLRPYNGSLYQQALHHALTEHQPLAFLALASPLGREITARLAWQARCWLIPHCTRLRPCGAETVEATRLVLGGQMERIGAYPLDRRLVVSMQKEYLPPAEPAAPDAAPTFRLGLPDMVPRERILEVHRLPADGLSLSEAEVVVAGGAGAGDREGFQLIESLADALGGAVAGSQVAVERGWIPRSRQIGRSGLTVYPDYFFACGISGSVHFTAGMQHSGIIVAINTDPEAPIFRMADLKIVGDLRRIIPALIRAVRERKN